MLAGEDPDSAIGQAVGKKMQSQLTSLQRCHSEKGERAMASLGMSQAGLTCAIASQTHESGGHCVCQVSVNLLVSAPSVDNDITERDALCTKAYTVPVLQIARICGILAKHWILNKTGNE